MHLPVAIFLFPLSFTFFYVSILIICYIILESNAQLVFDLIYSIHFFVLSAKTFCIAQVIYQVELIKAVHGRASLLTRHIRHAWNRFQFNAHALNNDCEFRILYLNFSSIFNSIYVLLFSISNLICTSDTFINSTNILFGIYTFL